MEETDEERRKEGETERGLLSGGNEGRVVEKVGQVESGRKEGDRECGRWRLYRSADVWTMGGQGR